MPIVGAKLGSTAPTLATLITDIEQYTFDATNDYIIGAVEVVHSYSEETTIYPHVHWVSNGSEGADKYVQFQLSYTILIPNSVISAQTVINTGDLLIPDGTADRMYYISSFASTISGTGILIGSYIVFRFERIAAAGAAPVADPFVIAVGFHVMKDSVGSNQEYVK